MLNSFSFFVTFIVYPHSRIWQFAQKGKDNTTSITSSENWGVGLYSKEFSLH